MFGKGVVMAKQNIAVQFEQAEFYTLQEASDYLNLKHGISNVTPKKLFLKALKYQTRFYIHVKGSSVSCDYLTSYNKDLPSNIKDYINNQTDMANHYLSSVMENMGLLLRIKKDQINFLLYEDAITNYDDETMFDGVLDIMETNGNPSNLHFLRPYIDDKAVFEVLALYPERTICDDETIEDILQKLSPKVDFYDIYEYPTPKGSIIKTLKPYFYIIKDDLIIIHKDLIELENNIINDKPAAQSTLATKSKQGKSQAKQNAQDQAKIIAKALWNNDKDKKIRMLEMAETVYYELYQNGLKNELPNNPITLKEWIKDVAPPYASEAGRPPKE